MHACVVILRPYITSSIIMVMIIILMQCKHARPPVHARHCCCSPHMSAAQKQEAGAYTYVSAVSSPISVGIVLVS